MLGAFVALTTLMQAGNEPVHPFFSVSKETFLAAYNQGREAAKKKVSYEKLARKYSKDVGKVRSPNWASWTAPYATILLPHVTVELKGHVDQSEYLEAEQFEKEMIEGIALRDRAPKEERRFRFYVVLFAWPGVAYENATDISRAANERDVQNVKFVVLIDGKRPVHPAVKPDKLGQETFDGTVTIPEYNTIYGQSDTTATVTATGTGGYASATGRSSTSSTVTYTTFRNENWSSYRADYSLEFPLFDKNGKPYITPKTKTLVLKIIRENGEHSATFKLSDYPLPKAKS